MSENENKIINVNNSTTTLTNDDINEITKVAAQIANENEDIQHIRSIPDDVKDPHEGELVEATKNFAIGSDGKPIYANEAEELLKNSDQDLMDAINGGLDEENAESFKKAFTENATDTYDMTDEEAAQMLDCILAYKKDQSINVYNMLPEKVKSTVLSICASNNIPPSERNSVAKMVIQEFISQAATDQTFIDFETALNQAMRIPSLTDLYNEHLNDTMDKKLPLMADAIEKEDPEKAAMLRQIGERFKWSISYSDLKKQYLENSRVRKAVRRDYEKFNKYAEELNYRNKDTEFKMSDATTLYNVLLKIVAEDPELCEIDAMKFVTLLCKSTEIYNTKAVLDASYIYYLMKNIIMLSYTNDDTKSSFSAELISNIKVLMYFIRAKESEFNELNNSSEHKQKRSQRNKNRK